MFFSMIRDSSLWVSSYFYFESDAFFCLSQRRDRLSISVSMILDLTFGMCPFDWENSLVSLMSTLFLIPQETFSTGVPSSLTWISSSFFLAPDSLWLHVFLMPWTSLTEKRVQYTTLSENRQEVSGPEEVHLFQLILSIFLAERRGLLREWNGLWMSSLIHVRKLWDRLSILFQNQSDIKETETFRFVWESCCFRVSVVLPHISLRMPQGIQVPSLPVTCLVSLYLFFFPFNLSFLPLFARVHSIRLLRVSKTDPLQELILCSNNDMWCLSQLLAVGTILWRENLKREPEERIERLLRIRNCSKA